MGPHVLSSHFLPGCASWRIDWVLRLMIGESGSRNSLKHVAWDNELMHVFIFILYLFNDDLHIARRAASRHFRNKKREYWEEKINELPTHS
jgi:hypothetical protein